MKPKKQIRVAIVDHKKRFNVLEDLNQQIKKGVEGITIDVFDGSFREFKVDHVADYTAVFCHGSIWEDIVRSRTSKQVVLVRMQNEGEPSGTEKDSATECVFVLRRPLTGKDAMQPCDWIKVLPVLTDSQCLAELCKGRDPGGIREYFFVDPPPVFLMALALKLQGFLVVHWEAEKWPEGKNKDKIKEAVQKAGWPKSHKVKEPAQLQSLGLQLHLVRSLDWWQPLRLFLREEDWDSDDVQLKEWRPNEAGFSPWSEDVNSLIGSLIRDESINDMKLAANAYCAIADRLGVSC